jgi:hypothetical protein
VDLQVIHLLHRSVAEPNAGAFYKDCPQLGHAARPNADPGKPLVIVALPQNGNEITQGARSVHIKTERVPLWNYALRVTPPHSSVALDTTVESLRTPSDWWAPHPVRAALNAVVYFISFHLSHNG